jgi:ribonuclease P protein component
VGFTTPRALGRAVVRNRIRRRMRESVRLHLDALHPRFSVVFNPRKTVLHAAFAELEREVEKVFSRCKAS